MREAQELCVGTPELELPSSLSPPLGSSGLPPPPHPHLSLSFSLSHTHAHTLCILCCRKTHAPAGRLPERGAGGADAAAAKSPPPLLGPAPWSAPHSRAGESLPLPQASTTSLACGPGGSREPDGACSRAAQGHVKRLGRNALPCTLAKTARAQTRRAAPSFRVSVAHLGLAEGLGPRKWEAGGPALGAGGWGGRDCPASWRRRPARLRRRATRAWPASSAGRGRG